MMTVFYEGAGTSDLFRHQFAFQAWTSMMERATVFLFSFWKSVKLRIAIVLKRWSQTSVRRPTAWPKVMARWDVRMHLWNS